jgi:predicted MFS family arabinose efflux permease
MLSDASSVDGESHRSTPSWSAVFALSLGAFALVSSEFMPVSLLTPIARDLGITEGQAGQAISVSGAFAVITSLFISSIAGRLDRKRLLLSLTMLVIVSGSVVALAPSYTVYMIGRAFLGIAIGGFWSMSAATAMRLVPNEQVPKALAIFNGGNALATVIAAPLGSFLGSVIGWRGAFFLVVPLAVIVLIWQMISLPTMSAASRTNPAAPFRLLSRAEIAIGMCACGLFFMGQFSLFTYLRPYLEITLQPGTTTLSLLFLGIGTAGFAGSLIIGGILKDDRIYWTLALFSFFMSAIAVLLISIPGHLMLTAVLLVLWGLFGTSAPVGWWTWVARTAPEDAEAGGGLMVAIVQLAIAFGSISGGVMFDMRGYGATFSGSAALLAIAAILTLFTARSARLRQRAEASH